MSAITSNVLQNPVAFYGSTGFEHCLSLWCSPLVRPDGVIDRQGWQAYAARGTAADGGGRQRNLTRRRRF